MNFYHLPDLPYPYDALEPFIDQETMKFHHDKHHQTYVDKLNSVLEKDQGFREKSVEELLMKIEHIPSEIRKKVINFAGGHANHSLFWQIMTPNTGGQAQGILSDRINQDFSSFADFKEKFSLEASTLFGSGWTWLCLDNQTSKLTIINLPNQDSPLLENFNPILGLDVWEHAYYLKYQNARDEYIENWWNVVNWKKVEEYFEKAENN